MGYKMLMTPIKIGSLEIRNRFVVPPMGTNYANADGSVSRQLIDYHAARARGGYGLIIVEVTAIDPGGKAIPSQPGLWDDRFIPGWRDLTNEVHKYGARIAVQLHHAGRQTLTAVTGSQPVAPSPVPCPLEKEMPREIPTAEVYALIEKFGDGAWRAREAGFDAVEIHGAHGYLVAQFMSAYSNKRLDEFGGNFINRMRFPTEIVKNIRGKLGNAFPIIFRMSGSERVTGGREIEESKAVAAVMENVGVNAVDVSTGVYESMQWICAPAAVPLGFLASDAEAIRKSVSIPVIAVGRIHEPDLAETMLETGMADLVAEGRQSLTDPELPNKVAAGNVEDIAPCISCMQACMGYLFDPTRGKISCLVNPFCGNEGSMKIEPTSMSKNVMIVGGGPGGLEAAWILAKRGHKVTLYEKEQVLGGQFRIASVSPAKQAILKCLRYYIRMGEKYGVNYRLGTEVTADLVEHEKPDVVVLATGGQQWIPDIKGIHNPNVILATDILQGKTCSGNKILIVGGGYVGSETADFLGEYGYNITIMDMLGDIALQEQGSVRYFLLERLKSHQVKMITKAKVKEFLDDGVIYETDGHEERLTGFDTIVLALGATAYNPLQSPLRDIKDVYVIGDAVQARKATNAIEEAAKLAISV